jgi:hypothetical protein
MHDFPATLQDVLQDLATRGLVVAPDALTPLSRIDFAALVAIHDHEEYFLRRVFLDSLQTAYRTRREVGEGGAEVTRDDVRTAMLMLGAAAAEAPAAQFSDEAKRIIRQVCPYCAAQTVAR